MTAGNNHDQAYWELVDTFINRANLACEEQDPALVSAALLEATTRFNAFVVAASSLDRNAFIEEIDPSIQYLGSRYKQLLAGHLEDYRENYKLYIGTNTPEESQD